MTVRSLTVRVAAMPSLDEVVSAYNAAWNRQDLDEEREARVRAARDDVKAENDFVGAPTGLLAGSLVFMVSTAQLRWFLVDPSARGHAVASKVGTKPMYSFELPSVTLPRVK